MRLVSVLVCLGGATLAVPSAFAQIDPTNLSVLGYQLVSQVPATPTTSYFSYRAQLLNVGPTLPSVTGTLSVASWASSSVSIVPGSGNLQFSTVPHNGQVTSTNTFTILVDQSYNFSFNVLKWSFTAPVADAGPNQGVAVGATVTLNASGSSNPAGVGSLSYSWAFTSIPHGSQATLNSPTNPIATFVADVAGTYVAAVTVSNGAGSDTASTTVTTSSSGPVANAGPNQTVALGTTVHLNGSKSFDGSGDPLTYSWQFVPPVPSGSSAVLSGANTVAPTFTADAAGTFTVQLVVSDGSTASPPAFVTITTVPGHTPPVANAGSNQLSVSALPCSSMAQSRRTWTETR